MNDAMHPAVRVTAGFFLILLLQLLAGVTLYALALLCMGLAAWRAGPTWWRVLRRMRFILLALLLLFAWQTAGTLVWPALGGFSPSREGLWLALEQSLRLLGAASLVALLLHALDASGWMNGLHALLRPLTRLGLSPDRFILRLRLVLDYLDGRELDWRHALEARADVLPPVPLEWEGRALAWRDRVCLGAIAVLFLGVCWWQG